MALLASSACPSAKAPSVVAQRSDALGTGKWEAVISDQPGPRAGHTLVFDSSTGRALFFGGSVTPEPQEGRNDTWEWDGPRSVWLRLTPKERPEARSAHAMAEVPTRSKLLLFGGAKAGPLQAGALSDTWEWDGTARTWTRLSPATTIPGRRGHAMAFDAARNRVVLFGGFDGVDPMGDTWEWDVAAGDWAPATPTTSPSARSGHSMVYDPLRKRVLLFGGNEGPSRTNDLWEWNGTDWTQLVPSGAAPTSRTGHAMVWDSVRSRMVLFGGSSSGDDYGVSNEVWTWDGGAKAWTQLLPTSALPDGRFSHAMVFDSALGAARVHGGRSALIGGGDTAADDWSFDVGTVTWTRLFSQTSAGGRWAGSAAFDALAGKVLVFGGYPAADAWTFDGQARTWSPITPAHSPALRYGNSLTADDSRQSIVLFGGQPAMQDTWVWSMATGDWSKRYPSTPPPGRYLQAASYDPRRKTVVIFGGGDDSNDRGLDDTWEWNGAQWNQRHPALSPSQRLGAAMAYDHARGRTILFGGTPHHASPAFAETWEWDGDLGTWTQLAPARSPSARFGPMLVTDPACGRMFLFGGIDDAGKALNDIWEWDGAAMTWMERTAPDAPTGRYLPMLVCDSPRGKAVLFGGSADGVRALGGTWEYSTPARANGVPCTPAVAAACASGFCVDGVCCAEAACAGTCKACNVPGHAGTCADVPAGTLDDSCAGSACDGAGGCKDATGAACTSAASCASGKCVDQVCCESDCQETCQGCDVPGLAGRCADRPEMQQDPVAAAPCDGASYCDGYGRCKLGNGLACTAADECVSGFCVDGACCADTCLADCHSCNVPGSQGQCSLLPMGAPDTWATRPCAGEFVCDGAGICRSANGRQCAAAGDCSTGICADGYCCDSACTGQCYSCNLNSPRGKCSPVPAATADLTQATCSGANACDGAGHCRLATGQACTLADQCGSSACFDGRCCDKDCSAVCMTCVSSTCQPVARFAADPDSGCVAPRQCDGAGSCKLQNGQAATEGGQCASGFANDGVCCERACAEACHACNLAGSAGLCRPVAQLQEDPNATAACSGNKACDGQGACKGKSAQLCSKSEDCASGFCADGRCCTTACTTLCWSCALPGAEGTCTPLAAGETDQGACSGTGPCAPACDGAGSCQFAASGKTCGQPTSCAEGKVRQPDLCDGSGTCVTGSVKDCGGYQCKDAIDCWEYCGTDAQCASGYHCVAGSCAAKKGNGAKCTLGSECLSGSCADGVCCNETCDGTCRSCSQANSVGTCTAAKDGEDPRKECQASSGGSPACAGACLAGQCAYPDLGTSCGLCSACDGTGRCNQTPADDPACGSIDCSELNTGCRVYGALTAGRCAALGSCKVANDPGSCTQWTDVPCADAGSSTSDAGRVANDSGAPTADSGLAPAPDSGNVQPPGGDAGTPVIEPQGCGCASTGSGGVSWVGLGLLGLMAIRAKRRTSAAGARALLRTRSSEGVESFHPSPRRGRGLS